VGIEKSPILFHNKHEGSGKLASQSVNFLSLHRATSHQAARPSYLTINSERCKYHKGHGKNG
jgi:hypothetical protein